MSKKKEDTSVIDYNVSSDTGAFSDRRCADRHSKYFPVIQKEHRKTKNEAAHTIL